MSPWWLAFIIPMSASIGAALMALFILGKAEDVNMEVDDDSL